MSAKTYPISQLFTAPQGEGTFSGVMMRFVRLAGCNVGKYVPNHPLRILNPRHSVCTSALGQEFLCDTDYHKVTDCTVEEAIGKLGRVSHVCLTGGEPFMHDIAPFVEWCDDNEARLHVETSGTLIIPEELAKGSTWITCSPKAGFRQENRNAVDEYKFVIDGTMSVDKILAGIYQTLGGEDELDYTQVYLSPINGINDIDESARFALEVQKQDPRLNITMQLHKILGTE